MSRPGRDSFLALRTALNRILPQERGRGNCTAGSGRIGSPVAPFGALCLPKSLKRMRGDFVMKRDEFLLAMDDILGLRQGTLIGNEKLEDLENWDSTALISLIALAETTNSVCILPEEVVDCSTVADLLRLAQVDN